MGILTASLPVIELEHQASGQKATVLTMIHIAPQPFYEACNTLIWQHHGQIFYEGIKDLSDEEWAALPSELKAIDAYFSNLQAYIALLAKFLKWKFQNEMVTYPEQAINADIDARMLLDRWNETKSLIQPLPDASFILAMFEQNFYMRTFYPAIFKALIWSMLKLPLDRFISIDESTDSIIVDERNSHLLRTFDQMDDGSDALFIYGEGHANGIIAGLQERGFFTKRLHTQPVIPISTGLTVVCTTLLVAIPVVSRLAPAILRRAGQRLA